MKEKTYRKKGEGRYYKINNFIYKNFVNSLKFIKKTKNFLVFSIVLFSISITFGYFLPDLFRENIIKLVMEIMQKFEGKNPVETTFLIMSNNIYSCFIGMFLGIFFMIPSLVVLVFNGYVVGFVSNEVVQRTNIFVVWKLFPHGIFELPAILISISVGLMLGYYTIISFSKIIKFYWSKRRTNFLLFIIIYLILSSLVGFFYKDNEEILNIYSIFYLILIIGILIYNKKTRILLKPLYINLKKAIIMFILIIIPLLVIAGIIEGSLIYFSDSCNELKDNNLKNECYYNQALEKQDLEICYNINNNSSLMDSCLKEVNNLKPAS